MNDATKRTERDLYITVTRSGDFVDGITLTQAEAELAGLAPQDWLQNYAEAKALACRVPLVSYDLHVVLLDADNDGNVVATVTTTVVGEYESVSMKTRQDREDYILVRDSYFS